jgi:hypothetical protein
MEQTKKLILSSLPGVLKSLRLRTDIEINRMQDH